MASVMELGPLRAITGMPRSWAAATSRAPGSATPGRPASLSRPMSWPASAGFSRSSHAEARATSGLAGAGALFAGLPGITRCGPLGVRGSSSISVCCSGCASGTILLTRLRNARALRESSTTQCRSLLACAMTPPAITSVSGTSAAPRSSALGISSRRPTGLSEEVIVGFP